MFEITKGLLLMNKFLKLTIMNPTLNTIPTSNLIEFFKVQSSKSL